MFMNVFQDRWKAFRFFAPVSPARFTGVSLFRARRKSTIARSLRQSRSVTVATLLCHKTVVVAGFLPILRGASRFAAACQVRPAIVG